MRQVIHMKAIILDTMLSILGLVHHHMLLCCVEYVGHTMALEIRDVTHSLTIANYYTMIHLVATNWSPLLLLLYSPRHAPPPPRLVLVQKFILSSRYTSGPPRQVQTCPLLFQASLPGQCPGRDWGAEGGGDLWQGGAPGQTVGGVVQRCRVD